MLRDFKFLRRASDKDEELENVPVNQKDCPVFRTPSDSLRLPFNTIQEPALNLKPDQEFYARGKVEKTPSKAKGRASDQPALPLRTPDKHAAKNRFGWAQKNESGALTSDELGNLSAQVSARGVGNGGFGTTTPRITRTITRAPVPSFSETNSTQNTPIKSVSKPSNSSVRSKVDGVIGARPGNFAALYKGLPMPSGTSAVVNSVDVPHFDLKEDPSFWMEHNVQVLLRVRPLNSMERSTSGYNRCLKQESAQTIAWIGHPEGRFTFDHVACETVNQEMLFRMACLPMVENCLSGYNSCMFAYGQTGSGKTYTMLGEIENLEVKPSPHRGMTPRIFEFLFGRIQAEEESRRDEQLKYNCKCSFLEIYNEQITDLLDPSSTNLLLREDNIKGVYVENLSEFEVRNVSDILSLLIQGSGNRKVAATNMNRESSRSHSVFTCVIESRWEKDSTTNLRFARLNLVDLAGSERQKTSGAEGDRLKEAANINKSLSTLGHVIMVLVDVAQGKQRHIPYRDSRLTYLLQDSLGGNSKTMIIANVSPSICSAPETLNTLKFAQRAKMIKNNAVVNEDSTGDVATLKHQIRILKEELSIAKRQNVSRALSFGSHELETSFSEHVCDMELDDDDLLGNASKGSVRISTKQFKCLETTLAGALRREQMAEASIKQLEAEIEQLNRLVRQREEDSRSSKMMLRFREDKIQRMESVVSNSISSESYLVEENKGLCEEIQTLQAKLDRNPEVTRFALENIRLLDQIRRFQDYYEEGEREILISEVSNLRDQLLNFLDENSKPSNSPKCTMDLEESSGKKNESLHFELEKTLGELEDCRHNLNSCLNENAKLSRELEKMRSEFISVKALPVGDDDGFTLPNNTAQNEEIDSKFETLIAENAEEIVNLQLELDILKIILSEERSSGGKTEERAMQLNSELDSIRKQYHDVKTELEEAKMVIEALESQQILAIEEMEELRKKNHHQMHLLSKQEVKVSSLKEQLSLRELKDVSSSEKDGSMLKEKVKKMQCSLEKAKKLNTWYENDRDNQTSNDEETNEIQKQVEAETAEVIVCLEEELGVLQREVQESHLKELEMKNSLTLLEAELKEAREQVNCLTDDKLSLAEEWSLLTTEIEEVLTDGCELLTDASDQLEDIASSVPQKRVWISENVSKMARIISEKELLIEELRGCLEDANNTRNDVENMLRTLRGATMAINEAHQNDILHVRSELRAKTSTIENLESEILKASNCATVAFVIVNRLAEVNRGCCDELRGKTVQIVEQEKQIQCLRGKLTDEQDRNNAIEEKLQDVEEKCISAAAEKLVELKTGVSSLISCMSSVSKQYKSTEVIRVEEDGSEERTALTQSDVDSTMTVSSHDVGERECPDSCNLKLLKSRKNTRDRDTTISLLRREMESALQSLKDVKFEMEKLRKENKEMSDSERQTRESLKLASAEILDLQETMNKFEGEAKLKIEAANQKLAALDQLVLEANSLSSEMKEELETEVDGAKLVAVQNAAEAACILSKFEEAQDTIKEADIMINGLVLGNEGMKLKLKKMKKTNRALTNEVQSLQFDNNLKNQQREQLVFDLAEMEALVTELEGVIAETHTAFEENLVLLASDFHDIKGQLFDSSKLVKKWLEDIWSEIVGKDCAVSVLHLCHMGILLETVTGLNAENGLLQHGLCESNAAVSDLRERNNKSIKELEICRVIKGKLLVDIKNSFDRVSKKEDETHELSFKLTSFDKKISDLQIQEEAMLERSNCIGSQLSLLTKELDLSNRNLEATVWDQEQAFRSQSEFLMENLFMKELESVILASTLEEVALGKAEAEKECFSCVTVLEQLKEELVLFMVNEELQHGISTENDTEVSRQLSILNRENFNLQNDVLLLKNYSTELECELRSKESEYARAALSKADAEREHFRCVAALEELKVEIVLLKVNEEFQRRISTDKDTEVTRQVSDLERENLNLQNDVALLQSRLSGLEGELSRKETEFARVALGKADTEKELLSKVTVLAELKEELVLFMVLFMVNEEFRCEFSSNKDAEVSRRISDLDQKNLNLQSRSSELESELKTKETELSRVVSLEKENALLLSVEIDNLKAEKQEAKSLQSRASVFEAENHTLRNEVSALESRIASLQTVLEVKTSELRKIQESQYAITEELCLKSQELESYGNGVGALKEENILLRDELESLKRSVENCFESVGVKSLHALPEEEEGAANPGKMLQEIREILKKKAQEFADELDRVKSENSSLQSELERKEEILKGLLFDLSLLQEAASNTKDQKDEIDEIMASLEALEDELSAKTSELEEVSAAKGNLEAESREKAETISALESAIAEENRENADLRAKLEDAMAGRSCVEEELAETKQARDGLEAEVLGMEEDIDRLSGSIEKLRGAMAELEGEREEIESEIVCLKERLEAEQARADESDAIAKEAQQTAESEKQYAAEKEAEVKLLERSVEELESTINVLEDKVEIVKGEAERQRQQREELEMELHTIKQQFQNVTNADAEMRRYLDQTEQNLQEAHQKIQVLESVLAEKDTEITQFKAHISELNLHAEAQASEYKQKRKTRGGEQRKAASAASSITAGGGNRPFKALEAMAENVRPDTHFNHTLNSSSPKKPEKYATRPRGSGSPFKCIGLGLSQQIKSERDEELSVARLRIEELESLSANRQKEIFTLNARLATADSMTHDVIRDLLGVKLDMTAYMSLMNNEEEVQKITEKARLHNLESQELEHEVVELRKKLTEFIEERRGWLKEIDRKQAELVAAQISVEKLRRHEQLLIAENEILKMDNVNHKSRLTELEGEIKQLSGHQNLHQRIHHHAKIKEENNVLKIQSGELTTKLRQAENIISRLKEELAALRVSAGKNPEIDFDEERRLSTRLNQTEVEKMQLAQKLLGLCTSVLKVAGITKPVTEISPSVAEEALEQIKNTVASMDRELQDLKYKNKITNERMRLFELMPQTSPIGSRGDENRQTPRRASQSPYFSPLDR